MYINLKKMSEIHAVQLDMMIELKRVMETLDIKYYYVHGSLLGAITIENFIPEDDDIDIAIFRSDYNKLLEQGNQLLNSPYFIQSSLNDDYPLSFAKMRNSNTTFIQPVLEKYNCNKGIYIDIFPIDYVTNNKIKLIYEFLLSIRINLRLKYTDNLSIKRIMIFVVKSIALFLFPSYKKSIQKRESNYTNRKVSDYVCITNGKQSEKKLPIEWFGTGITKIFSGIDVLCPVDYHKYLDKIYGNNYLNRNPAENRINANKNIKISANILDLKKSYKEYLN